MLILEIFRDYKDLIEPKEKGVIYTITQIAKIFIFVAFSAILPVRFSP
jgi:hypothetical protein